MIKFITTTKGAQTAINPGKKVTVITLTGETVTGFIPHWATCSGADRFRTNRIAFAKKEEVCQKTKYK